MGSIHRRTFTKPLPPDAEIVTRKGERFARWKVNGKTRTAKVTQGEDGRDRIIEQAATFTAKYRDGQGVVRHAATGCRDATAARQVLANLERRADAVRSGIRTAADDVAQDHRGTSLDKHFDAYFLYVESQSKSAGHQDNVHRCLNRLAKDCDFASLSDLSRDALQAWMAAQAKTKMSARTRNIHRSCIVAFANWCVETGRLTANPFARVKPADEDAKRKRRAMTEAELERLLDVARRRPLQDALTVRRGKRKGELAARVRPDVQRRLELLGWERALMYKALVLTGLRQGELAAITVGQLDLDAALPFAQLDPSQEKNSEGNAIPLRADLVADLRNWLARKLTALQDAARSKGRPIPTGLPADALTFTVPEKLVKILNLDLQAAGIPKKDDRGRTIDIHGLRHSFITLLSKGGVSPRTAQAAARHSTINLTMNTYTDPRMLDVHGALDVLPTLTLGPVECGTLNPRPANEHDLLVPVLVPTSDPACHNLADTVRQAVEAASAFVPTDVAVSVEPVKRNNPLTTNVNGLQEVETKGIEPSTPGLQSRCSPN